MTDSKYTSDVAQTVSATKDLLQSTPTNVIYYLVTVGSLLAVIYFGIVRLEAGLKEVSGELKNIDIDLQIFSTKVGMTNDKSIISSSEKIRR